MDENRKMPASPMAGVSPNALNAISPNQQRYDLDGSVKTRLFGQDERRDSTVQERAARFDQLANSGRSQQQKSMEATLKRTMVGLEEAEKMKKKYLAEATSAKMDMQLMETKMKKIAHRHEDALEYIARMKESHAHAIETKEKDIQRYRKTHLDHEKKFKQLGDKYQYTKNELAKTKSELDEEKQRSTAREQEAFESRSQLSTIQEELAAAIEKIKLAEQERDAFKAAAKSEEVLRIAAEGRIPLPKPAEEDDEFRSPKKASAPLPKVEIVSSEASEEEIELLKDQLEQERYRAEAAFNLVDFLTLECQFRCCSCRRGGKAKITFAHESMPILTKPVNSVPAPSPSPDMMEDIEMGGVGYGDAMEVETTTVAESYPNRTSTIFVPAEGIFRTVPSRSQQPQQGPPPAKHRYSTEQMPPPPFTNPRDVNRSSISSRGRQSPAHNNRFQARTPSAEPPTYANNNLLPGDASILSLVSPATSAAPSPKDNQFRAPSRQQNAQRYAENQNQFRREMGGREVNGGQQQQGQQLPDNNVIPQHSSQHPQSQQAQYGAENMRERPADFAAGRFEHEQRGEKIQGVGQESRTQKFEIEHRTYGREEAIKPPPFDHHLHRQNEIVNEEDAMDVEMDDAPVMQHREKIAVASAAFTHHLHRPEESVRHGQEAQYQPVRSEPVRAEMIRPMGPPPVFKRASPAFEHQVAQHHSQHSQNRHKEQREGEHREREHNFRTISTTTKIAIKAEEDDDTRTPLSAISHQSGAGFGLQRSGSTLSASSEPVTGSSTLPVSREEALAMIRERRGRARSLHQGEAKDGSGKGSNRPGSRMDGRDVAAAPKTPRREISVGPVKSTSQRNARSVSRGRLHGL